MEKYERYLELSKKIKEAIEEIRELKIDKEEGGDDALGKKRKELTEKKEKIEKDILVIIGQMYKGVLIDWALSIREGKIYKYKCQYKMSCENVINKLEEYNLEVEEKLGKEKFEVVEALIKVFYEYSTIWKEFKNRDTKEGEVSLKIEPVYLADVSYYGGVSLKEIEEIVVNKKGVYFKDKDRREVNIYDYNKVILSIYKDEIEKMCGEVLKESIEIEKKLDGFLERIKEVGGKYLIASSL